MKCAGGTATFHRWGWGDIRYTHWYFETVQNVTRFTSTFLGAADGSRLQVPFSCDVHK
jgi:hypothetical protein